MHIQKTSGMVADSKPAPEPSAQTAAMPKIAPTQTPKSPVAPSPAWSTSALIAATGLPTDKLSAAIVSFARFFSLPLKPELMASIRQQSLAPPETALKSREAFSLAAAAAESKGVELTPKGLETFASAIDPDWERRQDLEERNRRERRKKEKNAPKINALSADSLRKIALKSMEAAASTENALALLNRLPGKNGQRWIVLPFSFDEGDREFRVSLRVLLEADNQIPNRVACMALDVAEGVSSETATSAESASSTERSWLFVLDSANSTLAKKGAAARLNVYLQPELPPTAAESFARELALLLEMPPERVSVKTRTESFPGESGGGDDLLRAISEAV